MMFGEAERRIMNLDSCMKANTSRISVCENEIYKINNNLVKADNHIDIQSKISAIECSIAELVEGLAGVTASLELLATTMQEKFDAIRAEASEKPENPKQKIDLEIFEEKSEFEIDPFITPQYYFDLDDKEYTL